MCKEELSISCYRGRFLNPIFSTVPGEHHFCSIYLLNKFHRFPDYINPDGTKNVSGDIIFCKRSGPTISTQKIKILNKKLARNIYGLNQNARFSIEVKYLQIKFTKDQYNTWFVKGIEKPDFIIALTNNYFFIIEWNIFSKIYSEKKYPTGHKAINAYSKTISENDLISSPLLKTDKHYFYLNVYSERKLENKINTRFVYLNNLIDERVKPSSGSNMGPARIDIRTTEHLFTPPLPCSQKK